MTFKVQIIPLYGGSPFTQYEVSISKLGDKSEPGGTSEDQVMKYLTLTKKPTALRSLVKQQLSDDDIAPFANQVLTAKSWYQGRDPLVAENILREAIKMVIEGKNTIEEAINYAAQRVNQTF